MKKEITKNKLNNMLNTNLVKFITQDNYDIETHNPLELLNVNRFDIIAKYIYIKFKANNIDSDFGKKLYLEHIKAFNGFVENDESQKVGREAFLKSFDELIDSVKYDGFKNDVIIPLSKSETILDGAHRTASALYFKKELSCVKLDTKSQVFDYKFFEQRGLDKIYLDYMAHAYAKLKDNCFMVIVWPKAKEKDDELEDILLKYGDIVYRKHININLNGMTHLVRQAYHKESWVGNYSNDFEGARNKARWCFDESNFLRVFLLESNRDLIAMKDGIRDLFKLEKHAVHINDTKEETLELAELLFNKNSIHWMKSARLQEFNTFESLFKKYNNYFDTKKVNKDDFCLIGSVLSVYGVKETNDIDYITKDNIDINFEDKNIEREQSKIQFIDNGIHDLIYNPNNYFYAYRQKFVSLQVIQKIKANRKKGNDEEDLVLINKLITDGLYKESIIDVVKKIGRVSFWKRNVKFFLLKIRYLLLLTLNMIKGK